MDELDEIILDENDILGDLFACEPAQEVTRISHNRVREILAMQDDLIHPMDCMF